MALEALDSDNPHIQVGAAISLRYRLAQPEPDAVLAEREPVLWVVQYSDRHEFVWGKTPKFLNGMVLAAEPLYMAPPKREWVGLSDKEWVKELGKVREQLSGDVFGGFYRAIEAKLKEKNT
jgi:hypothetical protein